MEPEMYFFFHEIKAPSCPVFINGLLHEKFISNGADVEMNYTWHWADDGEALASLPDELWLITKDRGYSFDFRHAFGGYIVSAKLLSLMDEHGSKNWERSSLCIVNKKKEFISKVDYFFVRASEKSVLSNVVDLSKSKVELRKDGAIKSLKSLSLIDRIGEEIFLVNELALLGKVFCSSNFETMFRKDAWQGVDLLPEEKIGAVKQLWDQ